MLYAASKNNTKWNGGGFKFSLKYRIIVFKNRNRIVVDEIVV